MCDFGDMGGSILGIRINGSPKKTQSCDEHTTSDQGLMNRSEEDVPSEATAHDDNSLKENEKVQNDATSPASPSKDAALLEQNEINAATGKFGEHMAPVLGVPPPPPPAPHMGPDGLILPKKPYNPCLNSTNHKDLRRELLFNQKIGKNVLNQKSELQRALDRHKESVSRKEAERNLEETLKSDPRSALQRALEQRAKHIELSQQPQQIEPPNPLATARARLRSRTD